MVVIDNTTKKKPLLSYEDLLYFFEIEAEDDKDGDYFVFKCSDEINRYEIAFSYCHPYFISIHTYSDLGRISSLYFEEISKMDLRKDSKGEYLYIELTQNNNTVITLDIQIKPYIQIHIQSLI